MGQFSWTPPSTDEPVKKTGWTPPASDIPVVEKKSPVGNASVATSTQSGDGSSPSPLQQSLTNAMKAYSITHTPKEVSDVQNTVSQQKQEDKIARTPDAVVAHEKYMETPLGKTQGAFQYVGSKASKGALQIAKGATWLYNHTSANPIQGMIDEVSNQHKGQEDFFNKADKATNLGLTATDLQNIESNKGIGASALRTAGTFAEIAPTILGGEASGAPKLAFALQGLGQGKETMDAVDPDHKVNPAIRDGFIALNGAFNAALMGDAAETNFAKMPAALRGKISSALAMDAIKQNGEKEITGELVDHTVKDFAHNFYKLGTDYVQKVARTGVDLSALQAATGLAKYGVNKASGQEVFKNPAGETAEGVSNAVLQQAPVFGAAGTVGDLSKLTPYSSFKNEVFENIVKDPSQTDAIKQEIAQHGQERGWTPEEIQATNDHIDQIKTVAQRLPETIKPEKKSDAVQLVLDRDALKKQLANEVGKRGAMDESVKDLPNAHEEWLTDKIEQANDKLRAMATGKRTTYSKGVGDEEGKFFKTTNGEKEEITENRYNLEKLERTANENTNEQEKINNNEKISNQSEQESGVQQTASGEKVAEQPGNPTESVQAIGNGSSENEERLLTTGGEQPPLKAIKNKVDEKNAQDPDFSEKNYDAWEEHRMGLEKQIFHEPIDENLPISENIKLLNKSLEPEFEKIKQVIGDDEVADKYISAIQRNPKRAEKIRNELPKDVQGKLFNRINEDDFEDNKQQTDEFEHLNSESDRDITDEMKFSWIGKKITSPSDMQKPFNRVIVKDLISQLADKGYSQEEIVRRAMQDRVSRGDNAEHVTELVKAVLEEHGKKSEPQQKQIEGGKNATKTGNIEENNQQQHQGTVGQQQGVEENRQHQEEPVAKSQTETGGSNSIEQGGQVKKTILTKRAYEGEIQLEVKKHLEEKGLTRKSFSQEERSKQATDFINKFGEEAAQKAVEAGDIDGGMAASVLAQLKIKTDKAMSDFPEGSEERDALAKKQADIINLMEKKGYLGGEFNGQLAHEYQNAELDFANVKRQVEDLTKKPLTAGQEKKIKEITSENEKLKAQLQEAEAKLIEETDKAFESGKEAAKTETNAEKAKRIAQKLRDNAKLNKPGIFSAATPASLIWDGAIEVTAKSIEAGGKLADAIEAGIKHIKASDWYKNLPANKKELAEKEFKRVNYEHSGSTDVEDLQERFVDKTDNKFTPNEAKDIWGYMKKTYIENGTSYRDALSKTAEDLGLSWRQVSEAVTTPKVKRMSDEMWKRQSEYTRNRTAIKNWIDTQTANPFMKALRKVSGAFRGLAVFGHGGIFVGTHAGTTVFNPSMWNKTIPAFFRGWKFAYGNEGNYQRSMEELKNSPNYLIAQRAGLKNNPERINTEEYQKSQQYLGRAGLAGERGFNAIKVLRQDLFDYHFNKLSPAERDDPEVAKSIAKLVNLATGATNLKIPSWVQEVSFAGGMEGSRWEKWLRSPAEAADIAMKAIFTPDKATTEERIFAKVWARRVGEQLATFSALLLANSAIQNTLNPKNPVNYTNPDKPDFMKFKFGDRTIDPTSGMLGVGKFIYKVGKLPFQSEKELHGDKKIAALGKDLLQYGRGKLAPFYGTVADVFTGRDFNGNPLPYSKEKPGKGHHKLGYGEYALSKAPLPGAEAANVTYKSAEEHGAHVPTLDDVIKGFWSGAISGATGFRVGEYDANSPENKKKK